jgi:hypothetical protein
MFSLVPGLGGYGFRELLDWVWTPWPPRLLVVFSATAYYIVDFRKKKKTKKKKARLRVNRAER